MTRKRKSPITDLLRKTVAESGIPLLALQRQTGVKRGSVLRFLRGETSLRLDKADALAEYFGLRLVADPDAAKPTRPAGTRKRKAK